MKLFTRTALATALALGVAAPATAQFSNVYFFGDSVSDSGNYKSQLPPGTGMFTTNPGPNWAQVFAQAYGFSATPSTQAGGNNYAYGGARITSLPGVLGNPLSPMSAVPVATQVQQYLAKGPADGNAIYSVQGGGNDFKYQFGLLLAGQTTPAQMQATLTQAAIDLGKQAALLQSAGARYIMVWTAPDMGTIKDGAATGQGPALTALSNSFNTTLNATLTSLGVQAIRLNGFALQNEILKDPAAFGISNITGNACTVPPADTIALCNPSTLVSPTAPSTYFWADGSHPTTAGHKILADYAYSVVVAPQQIAVLAEAPLAAERANWRALDGRMFSSINTRPMGKFEAWAAYDYSSNDLDGGYMSSGDGSLNSIVVGGDIKLSPHLIAGMMAAYSQNKGDYGSADFKLNQTTGTVYVGWGDGPWYAGATLGGSDIDYSDVDRDITLGTGTRTETGSTGGYMVTGRVLGGYWFKVDDWLHGPTAKWTYQDIKVRAYQEQGANSTTMSFGQQDRKSSIVSLGWQASGMIANVRPYAKVTWEYEIEDDLRYVQASVYGMGGGFSLPAYQPDSNWFNFNVGAAADFGKVTGYISGTATTGKNDGDNYAITLGVRIPM